MLRIEIRSEDDGDDFVQELMREAIEQESAQIRKVLGKLRCPVHGEAPSAQLVVRKEHTIEVVVDGCCEALKRRASEALD